MALVRGLLRSPFARMIVLGTALFVVGGIGRRSTDDTIVIADVQVRAALDEHRKRTGRPPTPTEEAALVQDLIDDELMVHQALALGLDRDDVVVRRRMRQKMEALLQHLAPPREPTDADLEALRDAHPDRWVRPDQYIVDRVLVARDVHGDRAEAVAGELATQLAAGADPASLGDAPPGGRRFVDRTEAQLAGVIGAKVAATVRTLPVGAWSSPQRSARGFELLRVVERKTLPLPSVGELRGALLEDWATEQRATGLARAIEDLLRRYDVRTD